jgi:hypothetical protein
MIVNNLGQVAVTVAFVALIGVILKAISDWLSISRSKYVDVIAAERIKWVGELRNDFRELGINLDELSHQCRQPELDKKAANLALDGAIRHQNLIQLKLNLEDKLDSTIIGLINRTGYLARTASLEEYAKSKGVMVQYTSFLLKDEWEKAKREASGPLRWLWLTWKQSKRLRRRRCLAETEPFKSQLALAATPITQEEKLVLAAQGVHMGPATSETRSAT